LFKKHANYRSSWSTLRNDQSPKIIDGHKDCAIYLAKESICNEENGLNGNLRIRKLKLETSGKRKRQENKKAERKETER
jgi:CelD/BcsL family acetyltransferase involved in cellulose biosynthesis